MTVDQHYGSEGFESSQAEQKSLVEREVEFLTGRQHDERTINSVFQLILVVPVRVINKCAGPRWRHPDQERLPRPDRGRGLFCCSRPAGNSIVVAFQLDAVPVNRRGLLGTIDEFDFHGLPASEHNGRPDQWRSLRFRRWRRRLGEVSQLEGVGWPDAAAALIEGELQLPFGMPRYWLS